MKPRAAPKDVDEYIAGFPPEVRRILQNIREAARHSAPKAKEVISYRMPALKMDGILVYFAAFKSHIGLFPSVSGDPAIEGAIAPYAGEKGNLRFPLDEPIPYVLIQRIVRLRVRQDEERAATRRARRRPTRKPRLPSPPSSDPNARTRESS
jgi:uncharacterized protein YdhG (YjbR/CyaY superfamily)